MIDNYEQHLFAYRGVRHATCDKYNWWWVPLTEL